MEELMFHKSLHLLIDHFIEVIDSYIEVKDVCKSKVYVEIIKRSSAISRTIRTIATSVLTSYKNADTPILQDIISTKTGNFAEGFLQQDLLELSLAAEDVPTDLNLSSDDLHQILFMCSVKDDSSIASPSMSQFPSSSFGSNALSCNLKQPPLLSMYAADVRNNNYFCLSAEFETSQKIFQNDLCHLKSVIGLDVSKEADFRTYDQHSEVDDKTENSKSINNLGNVLGSETVNSSFCDFLHSTIFPDAKLYSNETDTSEFQDFHSNNLGWEHCMRQSVPCHLYSTELAGKEVLCNVTSEDSPMFHTLHDTSSAISEKDLVLDILDLLIGVPSCTFFYEESKGRFQMKPFARLSKLSHESTSRFAEKFLECGTMFYKLKAFCTESSFPQRGLVLSGLKNGIHEILSVYMAYIVAVRTNSPTMHMLRTDVAENAQLLITLGEICRIPCGESIFVALPKGLNLLSTITTSAWSCRNKENAIMMSVLIKNIYLPYFNYLNKWIADGVCCDPFDEFQIIEDIRYLDRKDELYWKFVYTESDDDVSRIVPNEIKKYSHDILQCGKSMRLLQDCCPELFSVEYLSWNIPPSLSMVFSYNAVAHKKEQCDNYILDKEVAEMKHRELGTKTVSEDDFHVEKQLLVDRNIVLRNVERKWNHLSRCKYSEVAVSLCQDHQRSGILKRSGSFPTLSAESENVPFSGILKENIGLLFSFCGYDDKTKSLNCSDAASPANEFPDSSKLYPRSFNQQLNLKSYFHSIPYSSEEMQGKYYKKPISNNLKKTQGKKSDTKASVLSLKECEKTHAAIPPGSFMDCLVSLLISEYGDDKEDIYSFVHLTSLQKLLEYNFSPVLNMRKHLIEKTIMNYVVNHLRLPDLLLCLKNTYFLQDESFSQTLCESLFERALRCSKLTQFVNWTILNEILSSSIAASSLANVPFLETASINFVTLPEGNVFERNRFLHYFHFEFKIDWPLNIIIHKACITQYARIFSLIMEMEFLCWLLGKIWRLLLKDAKLHCIENCCLENSPQYRKVMLHRFDIHQFIRVLHNCIHQDLGGPLWDSLLKSLNTEELSIDALEEIHCQYLEKAMARCFLTEETSYLQEILQTLILQVYKFCETALNCSWKYNPHSNCYELPQFERLSAIYCSFKNSKDKFYDYLLKIIGRKKIPRSWDQQFPLFLETILETGLNAALCSV